MRATVGIQMWGRRFAVAAGAAALAVAGVGVADATAKTITNYVALGDSYAAGTAILPMSGKGRVRDVGDQPSGASSPEAAHQELHGRDVRRCEGRRLHRQTGFPSPAPPQFAALRKNTELVTVGIGGNDIHLVELTASCINPAATATSRQCAPRPGGRDKVGATINAFGPKYDKVIAGVRERSPKARILLVGYPYGIRPGGCPGRQPMGGPDATYIQDKSANSTG